MGQILKNQKNESILVDKASIENLNKRLTFFGTCTTAAATVAKVVNLDTTIENAPPFVLQRGVSIRVKFSYSNTATNPTLNVAGTGAIPIARYGTTAAGTSTSASWYALGIITFTYDGTRWIMNDYMIDGNSNTVPSAYCETAANTAEKVASCTQYSIKTTGHYIHVLMRYANTKAGALTLNINSKGAKPIWINGTASSATNYTLPAGTYIAYYDGSAYHFRTDDMIASPRIANLLSRKNYYTGVCNTAKNTIIKEILLDQTPPTEFEDGDRISIRFNNGITNNGPKLNVANTNPEGDIVVFNGVDEVNLDPIIADMGGIIDFVYRESDSTWNMINAGTAIQASLALEATYAPQYLSNNHYLVGHWTDGTSVYRINICENLGLGANIDTPSPGAIPLNEYLNNVDSAHIINYCLKVAIGTVNSPTPSAIDDIFVNIKEYSNFYIPDTVTLNPAENYILLGWVDVVTPVSNLK